MWQSNSEIHVTTVRLSLWGEKKERWVTVTTVCVSWIILECWDVWMKVTNAQMGLRNERKEEMLEQPLVPDSFMDGYVIRMAAHSSPIEGQHLNKQNILLCGCKARIQEKKN